MNWRSDEIAGALLDACLHADRALAAEQSVSGIDAVPEVQLHGILAAGLARAGWGVHREVRFPGDSGRTESDRDRCDIVLTPGPGQNLADPVRAARRLARAEGTLFEPFAEQIEGESDAGSVDPADAMWLEIKVIGQHRYRHGVPGPNRAYAGELVSGPAADIAKLAFDGVVRTAASVVVLFAESDDIARHDLLAMTHRLLDRDLPVATPSIACGPIDDRAGNACVAVAVSMLRGIGDQGDQEG